MGARSVRDAQEVGSIPTTPTMDIVIHDQFFKSLERLHRAWWRPSNLWYRFKCWAWYRYTTIKPRYLGHTWCDRTEQLPHMMFEILSQFVEDECSPGHVEWYGDGAHKVIVNGKEKFVRDELQDLYDWWHKEYHIRYPALAENLWQQYEDHAEAHKLSDITKLEDGRALWQPRWDSPAAEVRADELMKRVQLLEELVEKELDRRLQRILAIRRWLWT